MAVQEAITMSAPPWWWVSPAVISVGGVIAAFAIQTNKRIARIKATLDLIERTEASEEYSQNRKAFRGLSRDASPAFLVRMLKPTTDGDVDASRRIFTYLNHYEIVAIGCMKNILDEDFYSTWMRTTIVNDWIASKSFIIQARVRPGSTVDLFINFEALARRMGRKRAAKSRLRRHVDRLRARLGQESRS